MRRRLAAFLVVAVTVVISVVGGATPAFAEFAPVCISDPGSIVCRVPATPGREVTSTEWAVNGKNVAPFRNWREISILCAAGTRTSVQLTLGFSNGTSTVGLTPNILCVGQPLANVSASCSSGGGQMRCFVSYEGGTPHITIRWTINGDERSLFNDQFW